MNHAASCADTADSDAQRLLDRLCDTQAEVVYFPVRHHSPACAMLVMALIEQMKPAAVLIEGPSDFNDRFDELFLDHDMPVAIYSYFRSVGAHGGAYYPFSDYSPEWAALRKAKQMGAVVQFIDLPWVQVAHEDRITHRYADSELRQGRYVERLCLRMQVENFDDLWDKLIESEESLRLHDYLQRVHSLCFNIRMWEESVSLSDQRREAFMVDQILAVQKELHGSILVVTGGFHCSALAARMEGLACPGIAPLPKSSDDDKRANPVIDECGIALTPYSYERLDSLTGYNSGMPSPGFYEHAWKQRQAGEQFSHRPLLVELVRELRLRKQTLSTADLIAVETSALGIAAIRGRQHVWRRDLIDAVTSALIKDEIEYGCNSPFIDAVHAVLRGNRRGRLAEGTRMPPLVHDIRDQLKSAELEPTPAIRNVDLDLLTTTDRPKSQLLHRLQLLDIRGYDSTGGTDFLKRDDLQKLWESWRIRWSPEFDAACIEASRYGTSLAEAVAARLTELSKDHQRDASAAAALLVQAARAGIETMSQELLDQLDELIAEESQFDGIATALEHLLFLYCHDEAFGTTRLPQIGRLFVAAFHRTLWVLETLGQSGGNEAATLRGMKALLESWQRAGILLSLDRDEFTGVLKRVEQDRNKPATVRGAAAGILWTLGEADDEQILADLLSYAVPGDLGDFLAGLFAVAREVAQRQQKLVRTIDRMLNEFGADDFQASLPSMRLAFTYFTPREKHYMLTTLFESLGLKPQQPLVPLTVDSNTAAAALAFEDHLFEKIAKYGLEAPHE